MPNILRQIIVTSRAPRPVAPYSQALKVNNMVYISGVVGMDKTTNQLVEGDVATETRHLLNNLEVILKASDSGFDRLVKTTVMLSSMDDFSIVNDIYKQYLKENFPARSAYQVSALPLGARVEIEAIALCGDVTTVVTRE